MGYFLRQPVSQSWTQVLKDSGWPIYDVGSKPDPNEPKFTVSLGDLVDPDEDEPGDWEELEYYEDEE